MPNRDASYLVDILDAARLIRQFIDGIGKEAFDADLMRQSAVINDNE